MAIAAEFGPNKTWSQQSWFRVIFVHVIYNENTTNVYEIKIW